MKLLHHKNGFTIIEMLIVLSIIALSIFLTLCVPKQLNLWNTTDYQIKQLTSKIDYYQSLAIKNKQTVLLLFRPYQNDIRIVQQDGTKYDLIPLDPLKLQKSSNLQRLAFNDKGHVTHFGRLDFQYQNSTFSLVFHIEQGRYRIIKYE
ncbi:competence type IV pilus minor pilin ComGD [Staphylococcus sp. 17KM0847]|uniref:competence type IV pilus minor pilin ComGD n=1 Tax=Staphylococcus sp. 17KM0847 TaxID=2583989 RepID=UPI00215592A4|nr:competence type IV pilus minor pilin ComGD [Staphylococcus sp. 17KM0847]